MTQHDHYKNCTKAAKSAADALSEEPHLLPHAWLLSGNRVIHKLIIVVQRSNCTHEHHTSLDRCADRCFYPTTISSRVNDWRAEKPLVTATPMQRGSRDENTYVTNQGSFIIDLFTSKRTHTSADVTEQLMCT